MDVKSISPATPFKVESSSDNHHEQHRRDGKKHPAKDLKHSAASTIEAKPGDATSTIDDEAAAAVLNGQMIDSEKVIELLSHRPTAPSPIQLFKKLAKKSPKELLVSKEKKLNRSF